MRLTQTFKLMSHPTVESLKKSLKITVEEAPQYLNKIREEKKKIVYDKLEKLNKWYVRIIGLDEVKLYQDRVTSLQEQLLQTQEKRREISRQLANIRQKSIELQDQIHKVKRQDEFQKFLELMKEETEILRLESTVSKTFQDYDQMERELFTAFSNAIRDSHEKQRAQVEYTKYFGLVLSIAGSFLAFVYTSVKKQDLKMFIDQKLSTLAGSEGNFVARNIENINNDIKREVVKNREVISQLVVTLNASRYNNITHLHPLQGDVYEYSPEFKIAVATSAAAVLVMLIAVMCSK